MSNFSKTSKDRLDTCVPELQDLFNTVIKYYDCTILQGHRSKIDQQYAYSTKRSKVQWPNSKHNSYLSEAVDVSPYPINWGNTGTKKERQKAIARFYHFAGYVKCTAVQLGIKVRWGGDWDGDGDFSDQSFDDLPHWEILSR